MNDPIMFLGVDGVLNDHKRLLIYRDHSLRLLRVVRESRCQIVLSSAWRYPGNAYESGYHGGIAESLEAHALAAGTDRFPGIGPGSPFWCGLQLAIGRDSIEIFERVIGDTPPDIRYGYDRFERRVDTIRRWIAYKTSKMPRYWVAVDDLPCIAELGPRHSLVTDGDVGLTDEDADRLIGMLTGKTVLRSSRNRYTSND